MNGVDAEFGGVRPVSKRRGRCVAHVDVDAFFAQVERKRDPSLRDAPIAIRQHQDIVCVSHEARALGLKKHDGVEKCRAALEARGGRVVHVHTTEDHMVSYEPYTRASYELHAKMHALCEKMRVERKGMIYEKASIDEAYVQIEHGAKPSERGETFAQALRRAVKEECGLVVSVGVARNKLLAKIASKLAKPDGVVVIDDDDDVERVFRELSSFELPHCKGEIVRRKLVEAGLHTAWDVRSKNAKRLEALLGLVPKHAMELCKAAHGVDESEVIQKVNDKTSLSAQITLTMKKRPFPRGIGNQIGVTGGPAGFFNPLTCGELERIELTVTALSRDLYEKVRVHEAYTHRWPSTITVKIKVYGTSVQYSKSAAFPVKFDAEASVADDRTAVAKKATELAILAVSKRAANIIQHVTVATTNFKSTTGEKEHTQDQIIASEADPLKRAFVRMNEKRTLDKKANRAVAKRVRNSEWMAGERPLPPVELLLALVGGWEGEDECPLEVEDCRRALATRQAKVSGEEDDE